MHLRTLPKNIMWYYRKHGPFKLVKLVFEKTWRHLNNRSFIFLIDLREFRIDNTVLSDGVTVADYSSQGGIPYGDMKQLIQLKSEERLLPFLKSFFERKATLWLVRADGNVVALVWTIIGGFNGFYNGLPMHPDDAAMLATETFVGFRGRNFCPTMVRLICSRLKEGGISRVYFVSHITNRASQRCLFKAGGKRIGTVRAYGLFNRYVTIWDKESLMMDYKA